MQRLVISHCMDVLTRQQLRAHTHNFMRSMRSGNSSSFAGAERHRSRSLQSRESTCLRGNVRDRGRRTWNARTRNAAVRSSIHAKGKRRHSGGLAANAAVLDWRRNWRRRSQALADYAGRRDNGERSGTAGKGRGSCRREQECPPRLVWAWSAHEPAAEKALRAGAFLLHANPKLACYLKPAKIISRNFEQNPGAGPATERCLPGMALTRARWGYARFPDGAEAVPPCAHAPPGARPACGGMRGTTRRILERDRGW